MRVHVACLPAFKGTHIPNHKTSKYKWKLMITDIMIILFDTFKNNATKCFLWKQWLNPNCMSFVCIKTCSLSKPKSDTYKMARTQFDDNIWNPSQRINVEQRL